MAYDFDFSTGINVGLGRPRGIDMGTLFDSSGPYGSQSFNSTVSDEATLEPETSQTGDTADAASFERLLDRLLGPEGRELRRGTLEDTLNFQKAQMREAGKYKAFFDMPKQIANAFIAPAAIAAAGNIQAASAYAAGAMKAGDIYAQGLRPMNINLPVGNYNFG